MRKKDIDGNYVKRPGVKYTSVRKEIGEHQGHSSLIWFLEGTERLIVNDNGTDLCLSDVGYRWLNYLPDSENWCMTAMYDQHGRIIEWYFDITKSNFTDMLVRAGNFVTLSPVVTQSFFTELEQYFALAKSLGAKVIFLQPINFVGRAKANNLSRVNNTAVFRKVVALYEGDPTLVNYIPGTLEAVSMAHIKLLHRMKNCGTGMGTLAIQPNGDCYPCPNNMNECMALGNIVRDSMESIWIKPAPLAKLRELDVDSSFGGKCAGCEVKHFCGGGCRGQTLSNTGDLYQPSYTCDYEKDLLVEMLWTAATKPFLFNEEAERQLGIADRKERETKEAIALLRNR